MQPDSSINIARYNAFPIIASNINLEMDTAQKLYSAWRESLGDDEDIGQCIRLCQSLLHFPDGIQPCRKAALSHLFGNALCARAILTSKVQDLDQGIEELHSAVSETFASRPLSDLLHDLASALYARWDLIGQLEDIESSIFLRRIAVSESRREMTSDRDNILDSWRNLSTALFLRFAHFPRMCDLDEVLNLGEQVLINNPETSAARFGDLCTLAQSLLVKWDYDGDTAHIERSIALLREAISMSDTVCPIDYATSLNSLSGAIQCRIHITDQDLEECVALDTEALALVPNGHPERQLALAAMATVLLARFTIYYDRRDWTTLEDIHREIQAIVQSSSFSYSGRLFHDSAWVYFQRLYHHIGRSTTTALF